MAETSIIPPPPPGFQIVGSASPPPPPPGFVIQPPEAPPSPVQNLNQTPQDGLVERFAGGVNRTVAGLASLLPRPKNAWDVMAEPANALISRLGGKFQLPIIEPTLSKGSEVAGGEIATELLPILELGLKLPQGTLTSPNLSPVPAFAQSMGEQAGGMLNIKNALISPAFSPEVGILSQLVKAGVGMEMVPPVAQAGEELSRAQNLPEVGTALAHGAGPALLASLIGGHTPKAPKSGFGPGDITSELTRPEFYNAYPEGTRPGAPNIERTPPDYGSGVAVKQPKGPPPSGIQQFSVESPEPQVVPPRQPGQFFAPTGFEIPPVEAYRAPKPVGSVPPEKVSGKAPAKPVDTTKPDYSTFFTKEQAPAPVPEAKVPDARSSPTRVISTGESLGHQDVLKTVLEDRLQSLRAHAEEVTKQTGKTPKESGSNMRKLRSAANAFADYLDRTKQSILDKQTWVNYQNFLRGTGVQASTVNAYMGSLKNLAEHARTMDELQGTDYAKTLRFGRDPALGKLPQAKIPEMKFNVEEAGKIYRAAAASKNPQGPKFAALWKLISTTGMRHIEARTLKIGDIDWEKRTVSTTSKNETKHYRIAEPVINELKKYLAWEGKWTVDKTPSPNEYIFSGQKEGSYMTPTTLNNLMRRFEKEAGVQHVLGRSGHAGKRLAITTAREAGGMARMQEVSGHKSQEMSERYAHSGLSEEEATSILAEMDKGKPVGPKATEFSMPKKGDENAGKKSSTVEVAGDKPSGPAPQVAAREGKEAKVQKAPQAKGLGTKAALEKGKTKGKQSGSVINPMEPLAEHVGAAIDKGKQVVKKAIDAVFNHGVDIGIDEMIRAKLGKYKGFSLPKIGAASEKANVAGVRFGHSYFSASEVAKSLVMDVMGEHWLDEKMAKRAGDVIVEDLLRTVSEEHPEIDLRAKRMSQIEFADAMNEPEIAAIVKRFKEVIQPLTERAHAKLGGTMAKGGKTTGAFANLMAIRGEDPFENLDTIQDYSPAPGKSVFEHERKGTAKEYERDLRVFAERMITGNYRQAALKDMLTAFEKEKLGFFDKEGMKTVSKDGKDFVRVQLPALRATPWGAKVMKDFYVRKDLANEFHQLVKPGKLFGRDISDALRSPLLDALTTIQIVGPTDFVFHTANMYSQVAYTLGAKSVVGDLARIWVPGYRHADALARIGWNLFKVMETSPDMQRYIRMAEEITGGDFAKGSLERAQKTQRHIGDLAKIGSMRGSRAEEGGVMARVPAALKTGEWIRAIDKAGRLALDDMYQNLVDRKYVKESELERREFINKMGQYNSRLMPALQAAFKDLGISPFVVAGRTFNRNAFQRLILSDPAKAANPAAHYKMKILNGMNVAASVIAIPFIANYALHGNVLGRKEKRVPLGMIDTGKDNADGSAKVIDPIQTLLLRRSLRVTGVQGATKALFSGKSGKDAAKAALRDIILGASHPWMGPGVRTAGVAFTGYDPGSGFQVSKDPSDMIGANMRAALTSMNPFFGEFFKEKLGVPREDKELTGGQAAMKRLTGSFGLKKGPLPTHEARVSEAGKKEFGKTWDPKDIEQRATAEAKYKEGRPPQTEYEKYRGAVHSQKGEYERAEELKTQLSPSSQKLLRVYQVPITGFEDRIHAAGQDLVLKPHELEYYKGLVREETDSLLDEMQKDPEFKDLDIRDKQTSIKFFLSQAKKNARGRMLEALESRSIPEPDKKKRRFSVFSED